MIEFIIADRCTGCNRCVAACPTNVFDPAPEGRPSIARQDDCQTCLLCELYCDNDALYVAPWHHPAPDLNREAVIAAGHVGAFRRNSGWGEWEGDPRYPNEHWRMDGIFRRAHGAASRDATGNPGRTGGSTAAPASRPQPISA